MKVLLIPLDSKIPNLALMKLSTYHKALGDEVSLTEQDPDLVLISVIFKEHKAIAEGLRKMFYDTEVCIGGSGYDLNQRMPIGVDLIRPDYSLYPDMDYSLGFTTRGCIRDCYFCIVREKEGYLRRVQHPREFHNPEFKDIVLLDNNILADKPWFMTVTDWILEEDLHVDINQGLDIRLMDKEIAERIHLLKRHRDKPWKFAFDDISLKDPVKDGISMLQKAGINIRRDVMFYVYCHDESQVWDANDRCELLRKWGTTAWVMPNKANRTKLVNALYRWGSRRQIFNTCTFYEYLRRKNLATKDNHRSESQTCLYPSTDRLQCDEDKGERQSIDQE